MTFLMLSRGRLRVYLAADQIGVVREPGWLRGRVECAWARVTPDDTGAQPWAPAVRALAELIASRGWRGLPVDVAVSSEFVRFALAAGIRRQLSSVELQGLAHGMFSRVLGEAAPNHMARELGIEHILCTELETEQGVITGGIAGRPPWGEGKAAAVREFAKRERIHLKNCHAYANGDEDVPFLEAVGFPRPVNPGSNLARHARACRWPVVRFKTKRSQYHPVSLARTTGLFGGFAAAVGGLFGDLRTSASSPPAARSTTCGPPRCRAASWCASR